MARLTESLALCCLLLIGSIAALAQESDAQTPGPDVAALQLSLQDIGSLQGRFEQQVHTAAGKQISSSSGSFKLLQPGYFFWRITAPDEQLLIASGNQLWHYDVELETATRRNIAAELSQSPLAVLSASAEQLAQLYAVEQVSPQEFMLVPRFENAAFTQVRLTLAEGVPSHMEVMDHLEQVTRIEFLEVALNPHLLADEFTFIPPDGVDVYYEQP